MDAWAELLWKSTPETDAHRDHPRRPYEHREAQGMQASLNRRKLPITEFVSQYAIGDNLATSSELLVRSRRLIADSNAQILRCRMRLLLSHSGKEI